MNSSHLDPRSQAERRRRAEERLRSRPAASPPAAEADTLRLLYELEVHQIELEMQNEELRDARGQLEASAQHFAELYDFAPVGYFTLDRNGAIRASNLTGARLLNTDRAGLTGQRFGLLVADADRHSLCPECVQRFFPESQE
jgi:PAS domain-containing protein